MTLMESQVNPVSIRAPREHGQAICVPQGSAAYDAWQNNASLLESASFKDWGEELTELRQLAHSEVVTAARNYSAQYRNVDSISENQPILGSGHQPQLFHPGVWFKNFALHRFAAELNATAINLIIDNDVCQSTGIKVPTGPAERPHLEVVPIDRSADAVPYESRRILDDECFHSFPRRIQKALGRRVESPLINDLWKGARDVQGWTDNLGQSVAALRHGLEGNWGLSTLELPLSHVCQSQAFCRFAAMLIVNIERLRGVYNSALIDYRKVNRIRSHSHPVPALATDGAWLEAPFWIYNRDRGLRRRLFVQKRGREVWLSDREWWDAIVPVDELAFWLQRQSMDRVVRPRALMTTCFLRLVLCQMFVHGIGGAKYDQLTDQIIRQLWDFEPPGYLTVTATLQLPVARPNAISQDVSRLKQALRELLYHPEDHLDPTHPSHMQHQTWAADKRLWLERDKVPSQDLKQRHDCLVALNQKMQPGVVEKRRQLQSEIEWVKKEVRIGQLLGSREFSACLFPSELLREELTRLSLNL